MAEGVWEQHYKLSEVDSNRRTAEMIIPTIFL